jgi:hypothetical protein
LRSISLGSLARSQLVILNPNVRCVPSSSPMAPQPTPDSVPLSRLRAVESRGDRHGSAHPDDDAGVQRHGRLIDINTLVSAQGFVPGAQPFFFFFYFFFLFFFYTFPVASNSIKCIHHPFLFS